MDKYNVNINLIKYPIFITSKNIDSIKTNKNINDLITEIKDIGGLDKYKKNL